MIPINIKISVPTQLAQVAPSIALYCSERYIAVSKLPTEASKAMPLQLYPNPTSDILNINLNLPHQDVTPVHYILTDASGRVLHQEHRELLQGDQLQWSVKALPAGLYYLTARMGETTYTQTFVKQR